MTHYPIPVGLNLSYEESLHLRFIVENEQKHPLKDLAQQIIDQVDVWTFTVSLPPHLVKGQVLNPQGMGLNAEVEISNQIREQAEDRGLL